MWRWAARWVLEGLREGKAVAKDTSEGGHYIARMMNDEI